MILEIGYIYKSKSYKRNLVYLGKHGAYHPRIGFRDWYIFLKEGSRDYIMVKSYNKLNLGFEEYGELDENILKEILAQYPTSDPGKIVKIEPVYNLEDRSIDEIVKSRIDEIRNMTGEFKNNPSLNILRELISLCNHIVFYTYEPENNSWSLYTVYRHLRDRIGINISTNENPTNHESAIIKEAQNKFYTSWGYKNFWRILDGPLEFSAPFLTCNTREYIIKDNTIKFQDRLKIKKDTSMTKIIKGEPGGNVLMTFENGLQKVMSISGYGSKIIKGVLP
jgi:hypothetical protein